MKSIVEFLTAVFSPSLWTQIHPYSREWDRELKRLMTKHKFQIEDRYVASLGGVKVWIENHPYASMRPQGICVRAKRATIAAATKKLVADTVCAQEQQ